MIKAKIIADSVNKLGTRLTTLELQYPRYIHAEFMTHRVFSRNAQSSRAIPVETNLNMVLDEPVEPIFMENQRGMQADEALTGSQLDDARLSWAMARQSAMVQAKRMIEIGVHKQIANRMLEPYSHIKVILSATEFDNFFKLRIAPDAQQEICQLAIKMKRAMERSIPVERSEGSWHLPYIPEYEINNVPLRYLKQASVARCARVSYLNHDKSEPRIDKDMELYEFLKESRHLSPFEHVATPTLHGQGNFKEWKQHREDIEWEES